MIKIGQIVDGKFRILRLLGRGGMSSVFLAEDLRLSMRWAVKEIPRFINGRDNSLYIQSAISEANMIKNLSHPGIVRIVDMVEEADAVYVIEDFVDGISLKSFLDGRNNITESMLLNWAEQVCDILQYLHSRKPPVIYRDMKPENLILSDSGHIKLIDFGIARYYDPSKRRDTEYLGTKRYAAPEQYEASGCQTDPRTDIYGFGMTFQHLSESCRDRSAGFQQVLERCIRPDPAKRYLDAIQLLEDIHRLSSGKKHPVKWFFAMRVFLPVLIIVIAGIAGIRLLWNSQKGSLLDPFFHMLEEFRTDQRFEREEEELLLQTLMPHLSELQKDDQFETLAYEIGVLYWYSYDYGPDHLAGIMASAEWFRMAKTEHELAEAYEDIGRFLAGNRECLLIDDSSLPQDHSVPDKTGTYRKCFLQLAWLAEKIPEKDPSDWHFVEFCNLAGRILQIWKEAFLEDGVSEEEFRRLYELALKQV